jgi:hypothetical protein
VQEGHEIEIVEVDEHHRTMVSKDEIEGPVEVVIMKRIETGGYRLALLSFLLTHLWGELHMSIYFKRCWSRYLGRALSEHHVDFLFLFPGVYEHF